MKSIDIITHNDRHIHRLFQQWGKPVIRQGDHVLVYNRAQPRLSQIIYSPKSATIIFGIKLEVDSRLKKGEFYFKQITDGRVVKCEKRLYK